MLFLSSTVGRQKRNKCQTINTGGGGCISFIILLFLYFDFIFLFLNVAVQTLFVLF